MNDVRQRVKDLKLRYSGSPQEQLLIPLPNPSPQREYEVEIDYPEFTSLCPLSPDQPDFATVHIRYVPDKSILELKSLKYYLTSYRTVEIFFEAASNRILDDLVKALKPRRMDVVTDWNVRGGTKVTISVSYAKPQRKR